MMESSSKKPNLKIAIIHPDLGIGGAERLIVDAAVELAEHGHSVHVFTAHHDKTRCFEETIQGPFPVTVYGGFLPRHIFYRFHAVFAYLRCIFVALCVLLLWPSFDVVVADQVSAIIPLVKLKKSTKVMFYCHFPDMLLAQHSSIIRRVYRRPIDIIEEATTAGLLHQLLRKLSGVLIYEEFDQMFYTLQSMLSSLMHHVLLSIDNICNISILHRLQQTSSRLLELNTSSSLLFCRLNFLSVNRFERKKNIGLAISSFSLLQREGLLGVHMPEVTLTLVGGFDERLKENVEYLQELKSLADREGVVDRVAFVTSCSTAERNQLLAECICVIYTPKDEHFGIVPLEAMAAQKPVIACNSGGPLETVNHGVTGFLCEPTPQEFSLAMTKLIKDPKLAEWMGKEAREHVCKNFSTKVFAQRLNTILLDVYHRRQE